MSQASDRAMEAAEREGDWYVDNGELRSDYASTLTSRAVEAAHDPSLGLDRSVCLRAVLDALREAGATTAYATDRLVSAADHIEREFGGGSSDGD